MEEWSARLGVEIEHNNSLNIDEVFEKKGFVTASFENLINSIINNTPNSFDILKVNFNLL